MGNSLNSTGRFSSRVADYVKYRPDYPRRVVGMLHDSIGLSPDWIVADIGCGTGISCRMFLESGNQVIGVEPNDDMRAAAESEFANEKRFRGIKGTAEATNLSDGSADLVIAAQAFHWFDRSATPREFRRILRPGKGGYVAILWNTRLNNVNPFAAEYDQLLQKFGTDYKEVAHRTPVTVELMAEVFGVPFTRLAAPNSQSFTYDDLCGRVRSSSYTPLAGQPGYDELYSGLKMLFDGHQQDGRVRFEYETELFVGRLL